MPKPLEDDFQRVHPLSPLLRVGVFVVAGVLASWRQLLEEDVEVWVVLLTVLGFVLLGIAFGAVSWWFTRFRIDSEELRIDTGVLMRRSRRISIDRLQAVDVVQPLLARFFGMAELRFEVAGGSRTEAPLAYLRLHEARRLRAVLLEQGGDGEAEVAEPETGGDAAAPRPPEPAAEPPAGSPSGPPSGPPAWSPGQLQGQLPGQPQGQPQGQPPWQPPHQVPGRPPAAPPPGRPVAQPATGRAGAAEHVRARLLDHYREPQGERHPEIARVDPTWLVVGTLLSTEFVVSIGVALVAVMASVASGRLAGLAVVLPALLGAGSVLMRGIVSQWGFVLTDTGRGWRLRSGLFDVRSQTVPLDRVQGVALVEPLLWRPLGWVRMQVDIAGYHGSSSQGSSPPMSTLLPVAPRALALSVLGRLVPGGPAEEVHQRPAPRSARWLRPVGWRFLGVGSTEDVVVTTRGWVKRRTDIVPHRKTQSIRFRQGPLQRRLGLMDVRFQTTPGPVDAVAKHRPPSEIAEWLQGQLALAARARAARRGGR